MIPKQSIKIWFGGLLHLASKGEFCHYRFVFIEANYKNILNNNGS